MTGAGRVPPGRAGILLLRRLLAVAERGAELLARKMAVLSIEAERLGRAAADAERRWRDAAATAQRRLDLAAQLTGDRGVRLATLPAETTVEIGRTSLLGLPLPAGARCRVARRSPGAAPPADAALAWAARALGDAVPAAADHAVAQRAATLVDREAELTRRRLRALEHRRIPALRDALAAASTQVEEAETADGVLRRRAAGHASP